MPHSHPFLPTRGPVPSERRFMSAVDGGRRHLTRCVSGEMFFPGSGARDFMRRAGPMAGHSVTPRQRQAIQNP